MDEGRGQGELSSYKPWIMVQDFPSKGMVSRVFGSKTERVHHLLSSNELCYFYMLDWSEKVIDIKEQFPLLDLELAIKIAEKIGVYYPYDRTSGFPYVLTSDFVIVTKHGIKVRTVKMASELKKKRVVEKLEIERRYWMEQDVDWGIVTEKEIGRQRAYNVEWLGQARELSDFMLDDSLSMALVEWFLKHHADSDKSYLDIINELEAVFDLRKGLGLCVFKHLAYKRKIHVDIDSRNILEGLSKPRKSTNTISGVM